MMTYNLYTYIFVMALTTYLIRVLPLVFFKKEITSPFVRSFIYYVPYACLAAMTVPAMITATGHRISGLCAFLAALLAAWRKRGLFVVAVVAVLAALLAEMIFR